MLTGIQYLVDIVLHLDVHLTQLITQVGPWTYLILLVVIFMETGFVVTPFLPGDSLIFTAGALAALENSVLHIGVLYIVLALAAILGDTANYWIGHQVGPRVFQENARFIKREYLLRTHRFYEKHGGKTILLARFIPIIRTFAPFIAGIGEMSYRRFISYNIFGGLLWTALFVFTGYFFGNIPFIKQNFSLVILAIILISLLPPVIEYVRGQREQPVTPVE